MAGASSFRNFGTAAISGIRRKYPLRIWIIIRHASRGGHPARSTHPPRCDDDSVLTRGARARPPRPSAPDSRSTQLPSSYPPPAHDAGRQQARSKRSRVQEGQALEMPASALGPLTALRLFSLQPALLTRYGPELVLSGGGGAASGAGAAGGGLLRRQARQEPSRSAARLGARPQPPPRRARPPARALTHRAQEAEREALHATVEALRAELDALNEARPTCCVARPHPPPLTRPGSRRRTQS